MKKLEGELAEAHAMIASQADLLASLEADKASSHRAHMQQMEAQHMKLLAQKGDARDTWPSPSPDPLPAIFGKKGGDGDRPFESRVVRDSPNTFFVPAERADADKAREAKAKADADAQAAAEKKRQDDAAAQAAAAKLAADNAARERAPSTSSGEGGTLAVTVRAARNLVNKDTFSKSDPYCLLTLGKATQQTRTIQDDNDPVWNETFRFVVPFAPRRDDELVVQLFDDDGATTKPNTLGQCTIRVSDVVAAGQIEKPYGLGKRTGTVYLVLEWIPDTTDAGANLKATLAATVETTPVETTPVEVAEEEEEEYSDWVGYDECMGALGKDPSGVEYELGFIDSSTEDHYRSPTPHDEVFSNAMEHALTLDGCVAFAMNLDWGVTWYTVECFGPDDMLRQGQPGWVTWVDPRHDKMPPSTDATPSGNTPRQENPYQPALPDQAELAQPVDPNAAAQVVMRAAMEKMGTNMLGLTWNERWVVLDTKQISLFDNNVSKGTPKTVVPLESILEVKASERRPFAFKIRTWNKKTREEVIICLDAKNMKTQKDWIHTIAEMLTRSPSGSTY